MADTRHNYLRRTGWKPVAPKAADTDAHPTSLFMIWGDRIAALPLTLSPWPHNFIPSTNKTGGTGVSPVQAQAKACGYHKLLFDCNSV